MRVNTFLSLPLLATATLLAVGCRDATAPESTQPAFVRMVSGDAQTGVVGQALAQPLVVRVVDPRGLPVVGGTVTFTVSGGGGVAGATVRTDADGFAGTVWTLGTTTADSQRVKASAMNQRTGETLSISFRADPRADVPARAVSLSDSAYTGEAGAALPDSLAVKVVDRYGNPVPAVRVAWTVMEGGGTISPDTTLTGDDGVARAAWTLGWDGAHRARVAVTGYTLTVAFSAEAPFARAFTLLAAGEFHACGIAQDGAAWCWGRNDAGQLGTGDTRNRTHPARVGGDVEFTRLSLGGSHSCGLAADSTAYCWGSNAEGQLGTGPVGGFSAVPAPAAGGYTLVRISAGGAHTCAAVHRSLSPICWGRNVEGQLGDGTTTGRGAPARVNAFFYEIAAGARHTCGSLNGRFSSVVGWTANVDCWGSNDSGQLRAFTGASSPSPIGILFTRSHEGSVHFRELVSGGRHSCAVWHSGQVECWGSDAAGQLGSGVFTGLAAGAEHTCGFSGGGLYCWGSNAHGQLGNPLGGGAAPVRVWPDGPAFVAAHAGGAFTCAVTGAGKAWCWGDNAYGQLGNGSTTSSPTPVLVR
ncbi:MAG TPA: hypothetical protein VF006_02345 [Longimicrobium sp.]